VRTALLFLAIVCASPAADLTALDRYVRAADSSYRYEVVASYEALGVKTYVLDMVSQTWLKPDEVDRTEWRHWLVVTIPEKVVHSTALLFINGGSVDSKAPTSPELSLAVIAAASGAVVADLRTIPNEPLKFAGDNNRSRTEDAIIAFTWDKFLRTGDERWPARLPMTKAAVRAMDTVTSFCATDRAGKLNVSRFVVAGASKRGWTTWTTAAVDRRVVAIMPIVIDVLNVEKSFVHHWRAYGAWSPAIQDYTDVNLMSWLGTPEFAKLMEIEDPYQYRDRLTIPKYLVAASGDEFFLPDSSQFYFNDLQGEKYLRYVPNASHGVDNPELPGNLLAYFLSFLNCAPRPRFSWTADRATGTIRIRTLEQPSAVKLWQATNPKARDFRVMTIGKAWTPTPVEGQDGIYVASVPKPASGFSAFFVELTFDSGFIVPWVFTTEVVVTPDVYPFDPPTK
jgi:PhoPQ-activated pathogenicity-related protein